MAVTFRLFSRAGCHLCDEMLGELESLQRAAPGRFVLEVQDIDQDPQLQRRYSLRVPVLIEPVSGKIMSETRLDQQAVLDYLSATGQAT